MSTPGGIDGGHIYVDVLADTSGLQRDLQAKVKAAADRVSAKIKAEVDARAVAAQVRAAAAAAGADVRMRLVVDDRGFKSQVNAAIRSAQASAQSIKVKAEVDTSRIQRDLATAGRGGNITIKVDVDTTGAEAALAAFKARHEADAITVKVKANTSEAERALRGLRTTAGAAGGAATIKVATSGLDAAAKGLSGVGSALVSLSKIPFMVTGIASLIGAVVNLGGAAVALTSAMTPALGTIALIPALATTAAQGILGLVAGFAGVGAGLKALTAAQAQNTQTTAQNAKAQAAAAESVHNAEKTLADARTRYAQEARNNAQKVTDAQTALADAEEAAAERIRKARQGIIDVGGRVPSRGGASTRVATAPGQNPQANGTPERVRKAQEDLAKAEESSARSIEDAQKRVSDAHDAAAERTIEATQRVNAALTAQGDAEVAAAKSIADAQDKVATTRQRVADQAATDDTRIATAEAAVAKATQHSLDAQSALTQARIDAAREIRDLNNALKDGVLDEEAASIAVERARKQMDKVNRSPVANNLDKREATNAFQQAQQRLVEIQQKNKDLTTEAAKANSAGVEGSSQVVNAQAAIVAAQQEVVDTTAKAAEERAQATRDALQGVKDIQGAESDLEAVRTQAAENVAKAEANVAEQRREAVNDDRQNAKDIADASEALYRAQVDGQRSVAESRRNLNAETKKSIREISDAQREFAQAEAQASKDILTARDNLAQAKTSGAEGTAAALAAVTEAEHDLALARSNQADTVDKETASNRALDAAYKNLSPAGREFVTFLQKEMTPAIRDIRFQAQQGLLPGVQEALGKVLDIMPGFGAELGRTNKVIADLINGVADLITSAPFRKDFGDAAKTNEGAIRSFGDGFINLLDVIRNLVAVGAPFVARMAKAFEAFTGRLRDAANEGRKSGGLQAFFEDSYDTAGKLWTILKDIGGGLRGIFHAARPSGDTALDGLANAADRLNTWANSPAGQKAMSDFFDKAVSFTQALGEPLGQLLSVLGRLADATSGGGSFSGFLIVLNAIADTLDTLSKIPGFDSVLNFILVLSGAGLALGLVAKAIGGIATNLGKIGKIGAVIPGLGGKGGKGGPTGGPTPTPGAGDRVQRVTWGPGALPVRIVGGVGGAPGPIGGNPGPAPGTVGPDGRIYGPTPAPIGPLRETRMQRLVRVTRTSVRSGVQRAGAATGVTGLLGRFGTATSSLGTRIAGTRLGGALVSGGTRAGGLLGGRVGRVAGTAGRFGGRLAGTGLLGFGASIVGGIAGNMITGNSKKGSGRSILGNAVSSGAAGAGLGATIGSIVPVIGTGIGAAVGGAIGAVYGAIKGGLTIGKITAVLADAGKAIKGAWDNTVGPLVEKVGGWFGDIIHAAEHLYDVLVGHSIIPDLVDEIIRVFGLLTAPIMAVVDFFKTTIPEGAQILLDWVTSNWSTIGGLLLDPFTGAKDGIDLVFTGISAAFTAIKKWVTDAWHWDVIQGIITAPVDAAGKIIDGAESGFGLVKRAFNTIKSWVTDTWAWSAIKGIITSPIDAARGVLEGAQTGFGLIRGAFNAVKDWVTDTWAWGAIKGIIMAPVNEARALLNGAETGFGLIKGAFNSVKDWVIDTFSVAWNRITDVITKPIDEAKKAIGGTGDALGGMLGGIVTMFGNLPGGIDKALGALRKAVSEPIHFILDTVINNGLLKAYGFLQSHLPGLPAIPDLPIPDALRPAGAGNRGGYAEGGVLPGYTPGRDVHQFESPTGGSIELSGGEAVMRPEFTRAVGADWVRHVNSAAKRGGISAVRGALGGFSLGGVIGNVVGTATDAVGEVGSAASRKVKAVVAGGLEEAARKMLLPVLARITGANSPGLVGDVAQSVVGAASKALLGFAGKKDQEQQAAMQTAGGGSWTGTVPTDVGDGQFIRPVNAAYGEPIGTNYGGTGYAKHTGQDFPVPIGTVVRAAMTGVVEKAVDLGNRSYGRYIKIGHAKGYETLYAHLSRMLVTAGKIVQRGDEIALSGNQGNSTGPHLHFEIQHGGSYLDPRPFLNGQTLVRDNGGLLPRGASLVVNNTGGDERMAVFNNQQWQMLQDLVSNIATPTTARGGEVEALVAALRERSAAPIHVYPSAGMDEVALAKRVGFEQEWARRA